MSSKKSPTPIKPSNIVDRRISKLFNDLKEASGAVRSSNNEELINEKKQGAQDSLGSKISNSLSEVFLDPSLIPPPEPEYAGKIPSPKTNNFTLLKGFSCQGGHVEQVQALDENFKNRISSEAQVIWKPGIGIDPEKIQVQLPTTDPKTGRRIVIYCDIERHNIEKSWDESDLGRLKKILEHFEKLLLKRQ
jgi:hypothetical protein